ncbi:MAG: lipoyl(octanoyl) transferase LipB [Bacteroidetes bacterium]|nr:lipoyl(octanoyl) transferase LipB [Bacteroidota bacterium]
MSNYNKHIEIITKDLEIINFEEAWDLQEKYFDEIVNIKKQNRLKEKDNHQQTSNYLLICEHNHVYTLGRSFKRDVKVSIDPMALHKKKIPYFHINRGGDITYHGPGQIVIYPIINLEYFFKDVNKYLRTLEQAVIDTLQEFNIKSQRIENLTGVWTKDPIDDILKKICSIGIRTSYWTTMHGLALNINTDLKYFDYIDPCGLKDKKAITMEKILKKEIDFERVKNSLINNLKNLLITSINKS